MKQENSKQNFTLIELLVVMAIISILASMLLPALGKARDKAKSITCLNNLKTIGTTQQMYSDDFNNWIVASKGVGSFDSANLPWYGRLVNYGLKIVRNAKYTNWPIAKGSIACPNEPVKFYLESTPYFQYSHYLANGQVSGMSNCNGVSYNMHKANCIVAPSFAFFAADSIRTAYPAYKSDSSLSYRHGTAEVRPPTSFALPGTVGRANLVYFDGHTGNLSPADMLVIRAENGATDQGINKRGIDTSKQGVNF
jgi:prepilin-type N-terminal cleavage/methylation domain-containing protein/prepilin-type processing-associated H-X9-DG protein